MPDKPDLVIPHPMVRPFEIPVSLSDVLDVWEVFIAKEQETREPQSSEMRTLMAVLRSVAAGLEKAETNGAETDKTEEALLPAEQIAVTVATSQVRRGVSVTPNVAGMLLLTIERLVG